jgi:elongation factor Ts
MADMEQIKKLRGETGVSITECKKALEQVQGNLDEAKKVLRERGIELAGKRAEKETAQGIVESYIHPNKKVGVLLELRCESDFVARSEDFQNLAHEICMQIAAMKPIFVSEDQIPEEFLDGEKKIYQEQVADSGKPRNVVEQIIEGKLGKYKESVSLMSQPWIKDQDKTVNDLLNETIAKIGEKIVVKNFTRYEI